jgi:hypothetical protein
MRLPRVRLTVRRMMATVAIVAVVCAVGLTCNRIPISAWSGAKWVNLTVLVVDSRTGRPIWGAEVELIHPFDDERSPVKGRTDAAGRVVLRNLFPGGGVDYLVGGTEHLTFRPFVLQVTSDGYSEFRAPLAPPFVPDNRDTPTGVPDENVTAPPLNLTYPVTGPVKIPLARSKGDARRGRSSGPE